MKTIIKKSEALGLEYFKRALYAFQVLVVGIAIPALFLIGISYNNPKKATETEVSISSDNSKVVANSKIQSHSLEILFNHDTPKGIMKNYF